MPPKFLFLIGLATAQVEEAPVMLTCDPESVALTNEGEESAWSCRERSTSCEPRSFDLAAFELRGTERVQSYSSSEDGSTIESVTRLLADDVFEETVQWRDRDGRTTYREVTRGRCAREPGDR